MEQILQFTLLAFIQQSPAPGSEFVYGASLSAHQPRHPAVREGVGRALTRRKGSAAYELFPESRRCSFHVSARRAGVGTRMEQICHVRQRAGMRGFPFGAPATTSCWARGCGMSSNAPKGKPRTPALSRDSRIVPRTLVRRVLVPARRVPHSHGTLFWNRLSKRRVLYLHRSPRLRIWLSERRVSWSTGKAGL